MQFPVKILKLIMVSIFSAIAIQCIYIQSLLLYAGMYAQSNVSQFYYSAIIHFNYMLLH